MNFVGYAIKLFEARWVSHRIFLRTNNTKSPYAGELFNTYEGCSEINETFPLILLVKKINH